MHGEISQLQGLTLLAVIVLLLYFGFKGMMAKTRRAYFVNYAVAAVIMLGTYAYLSAIGVIPSTEQIAKGYQPPPSPEEVVPRLPLPLIVSIALAAVIWAGGVHYVVARQARKAGRSVWSILNPLNPPFRDLDGRSWLQIALVIILGFVVVSVGLSLSEPVVPQQTSFANPTV